MNPILVGREDNKSIGGPSLSHQIISVNMSPYWGIISEGSYSHEAGAAEQELTVSKIFFYLTLKIHNVPNLSLHCFLWS